MGSYTHVHIAFACSNYDEVAALAKKHLVTHPGLTGGNPVGSKIYDASVHFLSDMSLRTGTTNGILVWGEDNRHFHEELFMKEMTPFFRELLEKEIGGICSSEHILIFHQWESEWSAHAIEVYLDPEGDYLDDPEHCELIVAYHKDLPFSWRTTV